MAADPEKPITLVIEDHLEAIHELGQEKKVVRVRDIAARRDSKMPAVPGVLKCLSERDLVDYEKYKYGEPRPFFLTPKLDNSNIV